MSFNAFDHKCMASALRLASRGLDTTHPNPRVGCVITRDGEVVGSGWHKKTGEPHAEINALLEAGEKAAGGTAYVTLEPCSHVGRTPPCVDALIVAKVARVIFAIGDPNPDVNGDKSVNLFDFGIVSARLFMVYERPYDLNLDGKITIADIGILIANIGK